MAKPAKLLLFYCYFFIIAALPGCSSNEDGVSTVEQPRPDEKAQTRRAIDNFVHIVEKNRAAYVGRGAHAKGHSCLKAYFNVLDDIDQKYRYGVFKTPGKTYKAWIRFSNANSNYAKSRDINKDAHGMAIKLLGVEGEFLTRASDSSPPTQDFLMADNPNFFSANINDYNQFLEADNYIHFFFKGLNPFNWHIREFFIALDTLKKPPGSPLWISYFSNTAYKLGPNNIKFSTRPCQSGRSKYEPNENDPDFMRDNLAKELREGEGCFYFRIQTQDPSKNMPIEDPSVEWKESDSPFVPVARIIIPEQEFTSAAQKQFCENLSFSPWYALKEQRPIGQFNRIRKDVYRASSDYRHAQNKTSIPQKLNW